MAYRRSAVHRVSRPGSDLERTDYLLATALTSDGSLIGYSLACRSSDGFQLHRLLQAVIRQQLPRNRQQATVDQVMALLAAVSPGDPEDPVSWTAYAQLTPHELATAPLGDPSHVSRQLVLDIARYLQPKGDSHASRTISDQLLDRWRSVLGPDHPDTLTAASILTLELNQLGEAEPARALAGDTLASSHPVRSPSAGGSQTSK